MGGFFLDVYPKRFDIQKDRYSIHHLAKKCNKLPELLITQIKQIQQHHKEKTWNALCIEHPILVQYERLNAQRAKNGYIVEQHRQKMHTVVTSMISNKELMGTIQRALPEVAKAIQKQLPYYQKEHVHLR